MIKSETGKAREEPPVQTREANPGGYKDTRGYDKPLSLAHLSNMSIENEELLIRLIDVQKSFDGVPVLKGVNFQVPKNII